MKQVLFFLFFLIIIFPARAQQTVIDSNTVALWHIDEGSGNVLGDATVNQNNGSIYHCEWVQGKFGSGLKFNGRTSYVIIPNSLSLKQAQAFTYEAWVALDENFVANLPYGDEDQFVIMDNLGPYPSGGGAQIYIDHNTHSLMFAYRTYINLSRFSHPVPYPNDSLFHHVAVSYQADTTSHSIVKLYLDGIMRDSVYTDGIIQYDATPYFYIGSNRDGAALGGWAVREFPGIIDEARVSNIARVPGDFGQGRLVVDKPVLNFNLVQTGSSLSLNLGLGNTSFTQTIHVDSIISSDQHFTVPLSTFDIQPISNYLLAVTYTPTAIETDTGTLRIYAGGNGTISATVFLTGKGFELNTAPIIVSIKDVPNDDGKQVRVIWNRSTTDTASAPDVATNYSIWRRVDDPTAKTVRQNAALSFHGEMPKQILVDSTLWDFIVELPAVQFNRYSYVAPTLRNADPTSFNWETFRVAVHTSSGSFYFSAPDSGYSLDNITPPPPKALAATLAAGKVTLGWDKAQALDVDHYNVYRSHTPAVVPSAFFRIGAVKMTSFSDSTVILDSVYYYTVTAVDSSGNESVQSNNTPALKVDAVPGNGPAIPKSFVLSQNYPNPFNPTTRIDYGIPVQSHVTITVYDLLGRVVTVLVHGETRAPGMYQVQWNPSVASGVYFYRVNATGMDNKTTFAETRKMVLLK